MDIGKEYISMCEKSVMFDVKKGLSETCCYRKLYGDLVDVVPHYQKRFIWLEPNHGCVIANTYLLKIRYDEQNKKLN